jgi:hypothetical protein
VGHPRSKSTSQGEPHRPQHQKAACTPEMKEKKQSNPLYNIEVAYDQFQIPTHLPKGTNPQPASISGTKTENHPVEDSILPICTLTKQRTDPLQTLPLSQSPGINQFPFLSHQLKQSTTLPTQPINPFPSYQTNPICDNHSLIKAFISPSALASRL